MAAGLISEDDIQRAVDRLREVLSGAFPRAYFGKERMLRFLTYLDRDVEIVIRPKTGRRAAGTLSVSVG